MRIVVKCGKVIDNGIESMRCTGQLTLSDAEYVGTKFMPNEVERYLTQFYEDHCHCKQNYEGELEESLPDQGKDWVEAGGERDEGSV